MISLKWCNEKFLSAEDSWKNALDLGFLLMIARQLNGLKLKVMLKAEDHEMFWIYEIRSRSPNLTKIPGSK